jgi:hypothetical protein
LDGFLAERGLSREVQWVFDEHVARIQESGSLVLISYLPIGTTLPSDDAHVAYDFLVGALLYRLLHPRKAPERRPGE